MAYNYDNSWMDEYEDLMFGANHTEYTMSQAAEIKLKHMPPLLYKYRACSENSFNALEGDFLYSSQPCAFNDIFEGAIEIISNKAKQNINQKVYSHMKLSYPFLVDRPVYTLRDILENIALSFGCSYQEIKGKHLLFPQIETLEETAHQQQSDMIAKAQHQARNMYNILCFSAINDSETMWAYYADSHKGFCVGYDIKSMNNNLTHLTFPVVYRDHCTLSVDDVDAIDGSLCMHLLTEKSGAWRHEQEWRMLFPSKPPSNREMMPAAKAVFLGARIQADHEQRIKDICKRKHINLYKMAPQIAEYTLIPIPISVF